MYVYCKDREGVECIMIYSELVNLGDNDILSKTANLAAQMQKNMNARLDGLVFRAVSSMSVFDSERPHASNVISIIQIDSTEIQIYKGDTRIELAEDPLYGNHMILINTIHE